jgi:hypothetical protein
MQAVSELLRNLEAYYGESYNETQRQVVAAYLIEEVEPTRYSALYGAVIRVKLYRAKLPIVEHFEEALGQIVDDPELSEPMYRLIEAPREPGTRCDPDFASGILDRFYQQFRLKHVVNAQSIRDEKVREFEERERNRAAIAGSDSTGR